jgi:phage terminase large subunit
LQLQQLKKPARSWNDPETARLLLRRWRSDPNLFAKEVFGVSTWSCPPKGIRHGTHGQADIMPAVLGNRFVSCRAAQKTGKTAIAAVLANLWPLIHPGADVIISAPVFKQIRRALWKDFKRLRAASPYDLGGIVHKTAEDGWEAPGGGSVFGNTVVDPEDLQGLSGPNNLWIVDEASGYRDELMEAVVGNVSGGGHVLMIGNPNRTAGIFYDSHTSKKGAYCTLHLSGLDTPNQTGIGLSVPGLADPSTLDFYREAYGEGTPLWDVRVLGNFPSGSINTVIPLHMWESACESWDPEADSGDILDVGIDCALFGDDDSVATFRRQLKIYPQFVFKGLDGHQLAYNIIELIEAMRGHGEQVRIKVDNIGIGAACFEVLQHAAVAHGFRVYGVCNSASPTSQPDTGPGYNNLGTQTWFAARKWFQAGGMIADAEEMAKLSDYLATRGIEHRFYERELSKCSGEITGRIYLFDAQGRICLEPKKEFKKRIGRSPDRADSLILSIYEPPTLGGVRVGGRRKAVGFGGY